MNLIRIPVRRITAAVPGSVSVLIGADRVYFIPVSVRLLCAERKPGKHSVRFLSHRSEKSLKDSFSLLSLLLRGDDPDSPGYHMAGILLDHGQEPGSVDLVARKSADSGIQRMIINGICIRQSQIRGFLLRIIDAVGKREIMPKVMSYDKIPQHMFQGSVCKQCI